MKFCLVSLLTRFTFQYLSPKYHQSYLIKIFSNHKERWAVKLLLEKKWKMFLQVKVKKREAREAKAIKINLQCCRWICGCKSFAWVAYYGVSRQIEWVREREKHSEKVNRMVNISHLNFRWEKRSIRAEIITFKLPIFLFMINMNSRCFGMMWRMVGRNVKSSFSFSFSST
jgi:hypothetical protein